MGAAEIIASLPTIGRTIGDVIAAYNTYQQARATLNETDRAKVDAAYQASTLRRQMDELRVLVELIHAEQT